MRGQARTLPADVSGVSGQRQDAVVVAVRLVGMMEVAVHEVVHVVTVRHGLVPAPGSMAMVRRMSAARVIGRAGGGIGAAHGQHVLVHMRLVRMV